MRCVMKLGLLLMMLLAVPAFMLISYSSRIGNSIGIVLLMLSCHQSWFLTYHSMRNHLIFSNIS